MSNRDAFLTTIAISEGTQHIGYQDGYDVLVGSTPSHPLLFTSFADHPRVYNRALNSTAAGRYQIIAHWWDAYRVPLGLADFTPPYQDTWALNKISELHAMDDVDNGDIVAAITKCNSGWASLPGSPYGQHTQKIAFLTQAFISAGGVLLTT